jgi:hypothetical protein
MNSVPRREGNREPFTQSKTPATDAIAAQIEANISERKKPSNSKGNTVTAEGGRAIDTGRM